MGFFEEYIDWAAACCDAPKIYNGFAALGALSSVVCREIYFPFGASRIYPNLWILLVGSSGSRKSVSMGLMRDLLHDANVSLLPNEFSQEKLLKILDSKKKGTFCVSEFSQFMGGTRRGYNEGVLGLLTDLYDVPKKYDRATQKGTSALKRPAISIVACSTPDYMGANREEWASGFGPRFLIVQGARTRHFALPDPPNEETRARLAKFLHNLSYASGVCYLEDRDHYIKWAGAFDGRMRMKSALEQSIGVRVEAYVLKVSMLLEFSMREEFFTEVPSEFATGGLGKLAQGLKPVQITIRKEAVERAIRICETVMKRQYAFVKNSSIGSDDNGARRNTQAFIEDMKAKGGASGGWIRHSEIARSLGWDKHKMDRVVDTLIGQDIILVGNIPHKGSKRAVKSYRFMTEEEAL